MAVRVRLRPTVAADLAQVLAAPLPCRIKAITAYLPADPSSGAPDKEQVLGVGGVGYRSDGVVVAFAALSDEFRKYPAAIHRAGLAGRALFAAAGAPVIAEAQPDNPAASAWLERLGFRKIEDKPAYVWESGDDAQ